MTPPKDQAPGLVARLRGAGLRTFRARVSADGELSDPLHLEAADRIEQLEAGNAELRGKLVARDDVITTEEDENATLRKVIDALQARLRDAVGECDRIAGNTKDHSAQFRRGAGACSAAIRALTEQANIRSPVQSEGGSHEE